MELCLSLLFLFLVTRGLGGWLPSRYPGVRFMAGGALVPIGMHFAGTVMGLPLSWAGWILTGGALLGFVKTWWTAHPAIHRTVPVYAIAHPVYVLPFLVMLVALTHGHVSYFPYGQDEFTSWAYWPKQEYVADVSWRADMIWNIRGYTQGWPLSVVFAQTPFHEFAEIRGVAVATLWHVGLLGVVYDLVIDRLRLRVPVFSTFAAASAAWLVVAGLLTAEAAWTLVPQLLQVEIPLYYFLSAPFVLILMLSVADASEDAILLLCIGLLIAAAYLIKTASVASLAGLLLVAIWWLFRPRPWPMRLLGLALLLGPWMVVAATWSAFTPFAASPTCFSAVRYILPGGAAELLSSEGRTVAEKFVGAAWAYLAGYKISLSVVAGVGFISAFAFGRGRYAAAALILFAVVYIAGLYPLYLHCLAVGPAEPLPSLQRYLQVVIRPFHVVGLLLLVLAGVEIVGHSSAQHSIRLRSYMTALTAFITGLLLVWQFVAVDRAIENLSTRDRESPERIAEMRRLEDEVRELRVLVADRFDRVPQVALIAQGGDGNERDLARYLALNGRRGARLTAYTVLQEFSWGVRSRNMWMQETSPEDLRDRLRAVDVIWPYAVDEWMDSVLPGLAEDPECLRHPTRFFLVRTTAGIFQCVGKGARS